MSGDGLRVLLAGDTALTLELGDVIDPRINARVLALDRSLAAAGLPGIIETVPTYRSLQVHYDPERLAASDLIAAARRLALTLGEEPPPGRTWRVPVSYGGEHGID